MKQGFMLLEVVVAVALLVLGTAFIGAQIHNASMLAEESEWTLRGLLLAESKLSELDSGLLIPEEEMEEEFGPLFPDYAWRLRIEPTSTPELNEVRLEILHQVRLDPRVKFDFEKAKVLHTLFTLRATPSALDLTRDFGMEEERADELTEQLSAVGGGTIDPRSLDPAMFANLDLEALLEVAPPLLEAFGMSLDSLMQTLPADLRQMLEEARQQFEDNIEGATEAGSMAFEGQGGSGSGEAAPSEPSDGASDETRPRRRGSSQNLDRGRSNTDRGVSSGELRPASGRRGGGR